MRELAGHQGVGESLPHAAVRRSKLKSFLLALQGFPPTNPLPGKRWLARLWASVSSRRIRSVRQLGPSHRSQPAAPLLNSLVAIVLKHKGMSKGLSKFHALLAFLFWGVGSDS